MIQKVKKKKKCDREVKIWETCLFENSFGDDGEVEFKAGLLES